MHSGAPVGRDTMKLTFRLVLLVSIAAISCDVGRAGTNAPEFLDGRHPANSAAASPPTHWSATTNVAWKRDLPGRGWSSPIVWGQRIFLTTCVSTGAEPEARKGLYMQDLNADRYPRKRTSISTRSIASTCRMARCCGSGWPIKAFPQNRTTSRTRWRRKHPRRMASVCTRCSAISACSATTWKAS